MTAEEARKRAIQIVTRSFGDDLERAKMEFGRLTPYQMAAQYGQSGRTRQEILDSYQRERDERTLIVRWLESLSIKE